MLFAKETRPSVVEKYPDLNVTEVAKKIGGMWNKLSDDEKAKYKK